MRYLSLTLPNPEENLALDEALLLESEERARKGLGALETLRLWECPGPVVVLGVTSRLNDDVNVDYCRRHDIPIVRRYSGGGTVLLGPGCLNYSLILSFDKRPRCLSLANSYDYILKKLAGALGQVSMMGISDLAMGAVKVSGNAQRRMIHSFLHHGTLLYDFDTELMARCLKEPVKQPKYRKRRVHGAFVRNLPMSREELEECSRELWQAWDKVEKLPSIAALVASRYGLKAWTEKY